MININYPVILRRQHIDAAANLNPVLFPLIDEEVLYRLKYTPFILANLFLSRNMPKNDKMVCRNASDRFLLCQGLHGFLRHHFEQIVTRCASKTVIDELKVPDIIIRKVVCRVRMSVQQLLHPFSETRHAQGPGQRIIVQHQLALLLLFFADSLDLLQGDNDHRRKQQRRQQIDQAKFMQIVGKVILIQFFGGIIQNDGLTARITDGCNTPVQTFEHLPAMLRIRCACPKVHGKHR